MSVMFPEILVTFVVGLDGDSMVATPGATTLQKPENGLRGGVAAMTAKSRQPIFCTGPAYE